MKTRIALVTGATRGIGLAIARYFAAENIRLVLPWYDWPDDTKAVQNEFIQMGQGHLFFQADLRKKQDVHNLANFVQKKIGNLDILINNIERGGMPVIHGAYDKEVNREQWQLEIDTTLLAKKLLFDHFLPLLNKAEKATVINISSIAGLTGRSGPAGLIFNEGYAAANRGIETLTETWARIGAPNIRVNEIMLGLIDCRHGQKTRGWETLTEEQKNQLVNHTLLARTGTSDEVAATVMFLVRDATYMTGTVIRMDGGYMLGGDKVPPMPEGIL